MRQVVEIIDRISTSEVKVADAVGRAKILVTPNNYKIGDFVLLVNNNIIKKVKKVEVKTYVV